MASTEYTPGKYISSEKQDNGINIQSEHQVELRITFLSNDIVRIRYSTDGYFDDDFSYGVSAKFVADKVDVTISEYPDHIKIQSETLTVHLDKKDLKIAFISPQGHIICRDERGFHWEEHARYGGNIVKMGKVVQEGEHYYGMGDKTMHLNLRGRRVTNWAMDTYGFKKEEDPIYKAIPFYTAIHSGMAYGIFFDNTFKSFFDFGSERKLVTSFWAEGGEMNYYFINGPELLDVTRRYTRLTGVPDLPPLWSLGYHQSKWSYYPESKIMGIASKMRKNKIPCDALYLDIDYMDGFRCFTWDKTKFPDPAGMIAGLKEQGFKTVVILDPGIKIDKDYEVFQDGLQKDYFCRRADGIHLKGNVWPGDCYFPDFTNPKVRKWWAQLVKEMVEATGIDGVWNDMNEPALLETEGKTFPDDVRHDFDGHSCSHRKAHNIYGTQMVRATLKGMRKQNEAKRPLIITRAAYAGTQRYAATWTGDNIASWEHLWIATMQCQRLAVTGYSFAGADVGGFIDHSSSEMFIRWIQLGVFQPFFRNHSSGDHGEQEPWAFGEEALIIIRKFIELRYQLLPYLYTAFYKYITEFTPILQPISVFDQHDSDTLYRGDEFVVGDHLLVCPVLEPNAQRRFVYLPKGSWYNFWTDHLVLGGKEIDVAAPLDSVPLFVRAGAVIPMFPVMMYVGEKAIDQLTLHVYYGGENVYSYLYEDSGDGYDYTKGIFNTKTFRTQSSDTAFRLSLKVSGHFEPTYSSYKIIIHGLPFLPAKILLNDKAIDHRSVTINRQTLTIVAERISFLNIEILK